ncbi:protein adenylyltransferase SelO family protein [Pelagibacterium montanilacus]|uniref:protein adenylyltransferase SelO family protein n=1 Tax=Pelagibacterium montanilacus TaxID=2185280 RepID=UPI000F8D497F|nr:YdiU family protein [Pelagibacterium montanilacus]
MTKLRPSRVHEALGPDFFDPVAPADFPETIVRYRNQRWAGKVGLGDLDTDAWVSHFGRFAPIEGSFGQPLALRYHGHQFQSYNPALGDGRGFLFAQLLDAQGRLLDLGTKGSGTTPWSRGGDGRLTLKGGVREVLATTMLEALGVDTSKSFSLIETGEHLLRGDEPSPTRSSVLVRLSHSHIRVGTFQRLSYLNDSAGLERLVAHCIAHYYPALAGQGAPALLGAASEAVARTGARMVAAGFIHGVLNTDNVNITGECFDYGPWRFLDTYDPDFTAAYFDETGLYAFGRQPDALAWTMTRLAEALLPISTPEALEPELNRFWPAFQRELADAVIDRLGLVPSPDADENHALVVAFFRALDDAKPPYEQVYFDLRGGPGDRARLEASPLAAVHAGEAFAPLLEQMAGFSARPDARAHSYFARTRPRTMLIGEVEALWGAIADRDDWAPLKGALGEIEEMREAYTPRPGGLEGAGEENFTVM